ncbi:AlbA family DNA-binding domain-containing protein [Cerasicoccus fimbriatus]|uniref:AlbA family DNA-binding domain-containing protein n=1 Tax=Cerasicoccus fimbriatus TaxID=3014554 RepID=UPI0022B531F1|nr:ATP-binding protein [Cerasicoccus sp. TK19100]
MIFEVMTEADIDNLTEGESNSLEFKGSRLFERSIDDICKALAKAVSAFANTGGGRLILGVHDGNKTGDRFIDGGIPLDFKRPNTFEWLNNQISALVDPPLQDFSIQVIERKDETSKIEPGRAVIVIDIGDSEQAPHQSTKDLLFYGRLGGKSQPLSHRFIMDIANRRKHPVIDVRIAIDKDDKPPTLRYLVSNVGKIMAHYVIGRLAVPNEFHCLEDTARDMMVESGQVRKGIYFEFKNIAPGRSKVGFVKVVIPFKLPENRLNELCFYWDVSADDAPLLKKKSLFGDLELVT